MKKVVEEIPYPEISGQVCRVLPYHKIKEQSYEVQGCIFVKGLPKTYTHKHLSDMFVSFGEISSAKVSIDSQHVSKGYGFVHFKVAENAQKAITDVNSNYNLFFADEFKGH